MDPALNLRAPSFSKDRSLSGFRCPAVTWLTENWHVTHSTLPIWKTKRNVQIQYAPLPPSNASIPMENTDRLDDVVRYQRLTGEKILQVRGVDKCVSSNDNRGEWNWRGKGMLAIASSHWEILAWGEETGTKNKWVVTIFAKTWFTPMGLDIYSQSRDGLQVTTLDAIKQALDNIQDKCVNDLIVGLFEVKIG